MEPWGSLVLVIRSRARSPLVPLEKMTLYTLSRVSLMPYVLATSGVWRLSRGKYRSLALSMTLAGDSFAPGAAWAVWTAGLAALAGLPTLALTLGARAWRLAGAAALGSRISLPLTWDTLNAPVRNGMNASGN